MKGQMLDCMLNVKVVHTAGSVRYHYVLPSRDKNRTGVERHLLSPAEDYVGLVV